MTTATLDPGTYVLTVTDEGVCARRLADEPIDLSDLLAPYVATRRPVVESAVDLTERLAPYGDGGG